MTTYRFRNPERKKSTGGSSGGESRMELSRLGSRLKLYLPGAWHHSQRQTMAPNPASFPFFFHLGERLQIQYYTCEAAPCLCTCQRHDAETSATIRTTDSQQIEKKLLTHFSAPN